MNRFGRVIFQLRIKRRILQKVIAGRCGIDASYLASIERGRRRPPPDPLVERLLQALEADEREKYKAREAAALDRLIPLIESAALDIRGAGVFSRVLQTLPYLNDRQLDAIDALIQSMSPLEKEEHMP